MMLIFAGASRLSRRDRLSGDLIREILREASAPVIIARSYGESIPFERCWFRQLGHRIHELGSRSRCYTHNCWKIKVSALHVMENPTLRQGIFNLRQSGRLGQEIVDAITTARDKGKNYRIH